MPALMPSKKSIAILWVSAVQDAVREFGGPLLPRSDSYWAYECTLLARLKNHDAALNAS